MAIGKITGSVVADNTITESNLAFGIDGQTSATSWTTDTLKVNIIESDDSTAIQLNDSLNILGTLSANTIDVNQLQSGDSTSISVADNLVPAADNTYSLGTADRKWSALYVTGSTIFLDTTKLQVDGSGDFTVKDAGNNLKRVVASEIEIGTGDSKIKMQRGDNGRVKFLDENNTPTPVLQIVGDDSTGVSLNTNETVKIAGAQNITTAVSDDTLTITGPDLSAFITAASTDTLTNKTFDANGLGNAISNLEVADFASGVVDTDISSVSGSDDTLASAKAIKTYVDSVAGGTITLGDSQSNSGSVNINGSQDLEFRSGDSITMTVNGNGVTASLNKTIDVNTIASSDSTAIQINDGLNVSGTVSVDTIDVNTITSGDSTGININDTKLYVNGSTVLTIDTADEPELTTSAADVDHVIINDGGQAKRIALGNINISSFNNDANYASAASTGFVNSTVTTIPISSDSTATDYSDDEPAGVGTATDTTDAFGVPLGTTFDTMEPRGTTQATDFGSEEAHVGA